MSQDLLELLPLEGPFHLEVEEVLFHLEVGEVLLLVELLGQE